MHKVASGVLVQLKILGNVVVENTFGIARSKCVRLAGRVVQTVILATLKCSPTRLMYDLFVTALDYC